MTERQREKLEETIRQMSTEEKRDLLRQLMESLNGGAEKPAESVSPTVSGRPALGETLRAIRSDIVNEVDSLADREALEVEIRSRRGVRNDQWP